VLTFALSRNRPFPNQCFPLKGGKRETLVLGHTAVFPGNTGKRRETGNADMSAGAAWQHVATHQGGACMSPTALITAREQP